MAGVLDLSVAATTGHDVFVRNLLGGLPDDHPDRHHIGSPTEHLPIGLPVTVLHSTADQAGGPTRSPNHVTAAGDPAVLHTFEDAGHGDIGNVTSSAGAEPRAVILDHVHAQDAWVATHA